MFLIGLGCCAVMVIGIATWNHFRYKHKRKRYEPFVDSNHRFRDRISEGYLTVFLWLTLLALIYLTKASWVAAFGPNPISAMPLIAILAAGIGFFNLFTAAVNMTFSGNAYRQARLNGSAQMICYMTNSEGQTVIRFENASSSGAAYGVKAFVANEDQSATKRFIEKDIMLLEAPSFPPGRFQDYVIPSLEQDDVDRGVKFEVRIEWTAFHDQSLAGSFLLKTPLSLRKAA
jgi:hypothetical protein